MKDSTVGVLQVFNVYATTYSSSTPEDKYVKFIVVAYRTQNLSFWEKRWHIARKHSKKRIVVAHRLYTIFCEKFL